MNMALLCRYTYRYMPFLLLFLYTSPWKQLFWHLLEAPYDHTIITCLWELFYEHVPGAGDALRVPHSGPQEQCQAHGHGEEAPVQEVAGTHGEWLDHSANECTHNLLTYSVFTDPWLTPWRERTGIPATINVTLQLCIHGQGVEAGYLVPSMLEVDDQTTRCSKFWAKIKSDNHYPPTNTDQTFFCCNLIIRWRVCLRETK